MREPTIIRFRIAKDYSHILWLIQLNGDVTDYRYWVEWLTPDGIVLRRDGSRYRTNAERLFDERLKDHTYADYIQPHL